MKILHIGLSTGENGLTKALKSIGEYREIESGANLPASVQSVTSEWIPDIVFMQIQAEGIISVDLVQGLMNKGCKVYNWTGDVRVPIPQWYIDIGRHITSSLFTNMNDVETLRGLGINADYLPIGYDEAIYYPDFTRAHILYRSVFMANNYNDLFTLSELRKVLARELKARYGAMFGLFGSGWQDNAGSFMNDQKGEADMYRSVPIGINVSHYDLRRYSSDRILRIMGSGAVCLCKWYPDIEQDYTDGVHLRVWKTIPELFELIDYYSNSANEHERKAIAVLGHKYTKENFTWQKMIDNLIKIHKLYEQ